MTALAAVNDLARRIGEIRSRADLAAALEEAGRAMGMRYFALLHHVDFAEAPQSLRLHNYPDGWEEWYDAHRLGLTDPVHRASHCRVHGFYWRDMASIIPLLPSDRRLLERGRRVGLGEGITIPANLPGERRGSCTFVTGDGEPPPDGLLLCAQSIGVIAFESARKLVRGKAGRRVRISERQRDCIALAGRGKSNAEIARLLGIGEQTVIEHFRAARARLEVQTRTQLVVCLLAHGLLCVDDMRLPLPAAARRG